MYIIKKRCSLLGENDKNDHKLRALLGHGLTYAIFNRNITQNKMNQLQMNLQNINQYNLHLLHTSTLPILQDQLFSIILSFMSLNDTLNLRLVSKHFRNTVSKSNHHLWMDPERKDQRVVFPRTGVFPQPRVNK